MIVAFACNECCYAAADLAGTSHFEYPSNILIVRVPCSGRVDLVHILRAFENGADGVIVGGCLEDQCHYVDGNLRAGARVELLKHVLEPLGIDPQRLRMVFISASMGAQFAEIAHDMTATIKGLGPANIERVEDVSPADKREYLRAMFRPMLKGRRDLGEIPVPAEGAGFGLVVIDSKKCLSCGACDFVCRDDALNVGLEAGRFIVKYSHWRCRNCGACKEVCPAECIEIRPVLDLDRFISVDREALVETEPAKCERCGEIFAPEAMRVHLGKIEPGSKIVIPTQCARCRRFSEAEKRATALGLGNKAKAK